MNSVGQPANTFKEETIFGNALRSVGAPIPKVETIFGNASLSVGALGGPYAHSERYAFLAARKRFAFPHAINPVDFWQL